MYKRQELYLHLTIAVEVLFDRIKQVSIGLDKLGMHNHEMDFEKVDQLVD